MECIKTRFPLPNLFLKKIIFFPVFEENERAPYTNSSSFWPESFDLMGLGVFLAYFFGVFERRRVKLMPRRMHLDESPAP